MSLYQRKYMQKHLLIAISCIIASLYGLSNVFAVQIHLNTLGMQALIQQFSSVHFMAPGNNFLGGIFWLDTKNVEKQTINIKPHHSKTCTKQIKGIYFNSQRGNRIWPLDEETLTTLQSYNTTYNTLHITGWWYTNCDSGSNYGIFGDITFHRWNHTSHLVAGTKLRYTGNTLQAAMANNFQYFDNKTPLGYLYDSEWGIGFVGGKGTTDCYSRLIQQTNNNTSINDNFMYSWWTIVPRDPTCILQVGAANAAMESMRNMIIQWSVGLSNSVPNSERNVVLGNTNTKTVIYNSNDIQSTTIINRAQKRAQQLCQGKIKNPDLATTNDSILCYENTNLTIDITQSWTYQNKTIIIKNGNVFLSGGMTKNDPPLNVFIDKWLLYLPTEPWIYQNFDDQWFPATSGKYAWMYLKGNFIINGIIVWANMTSFSHKLHLQGKLITLNTPTPASDIRKKQLNNIFPNLSGYIPYITLANVFVRTCGLNGSGSDETICGTNTIWSTPLVILNGNYPSKLLQ